MSKTNGGLLCVWDAIHESRDPILCFGPGRTWQGDVAVVGQLPQSTNRIQDPCACELLRERCLALDHSLEDFTELKHLLPG